VTSRPPGNFFMAIAGSGLFFHETSPSRLRRFESLIEPDPTAVHPCVKVEEIDRHPHFLWD
jgi:hypothetical protein